MKRLYFLLILFVFLLPNAFGQAPTNGLVAYYPFNGNANDAAGTNHGTVNGATLTTDRFGQDNKAYNFGGNTWIRVAANSQFEFNDFTFSVWFYTSGNSLGYFLMYPAISSPEDSWGLGIASNYAEAYLFPSNWLRATNSVVINKWQNVIFKKSGTTAKIFIDGVLNGSFEGLPLQLDYRSPRSLIIGGDDDAGNDGNADTHWYSGKLDDIRIYNRALSDAEVAALYASESSGSATVNPIVYMLENTLQVQKGNSLKVQFKAKTGN